MAHYEPRFKPSVAKDLRGIPPVDVRRILERIETLRDDPRPAGSEKLSSRERYRVRQGNYHILYTVTDSEVLVEIVKIGHRGDVYRET